MDLRTDLIGINCPLDAAGDRNLIAKDTLVRAAGVGEKDGDNERTISGCWLLGTGLWFLASGYWLLDTGSWLLVSGSLHLVSGTWFFWIGISISM